MNCGHLATWYSLSSPLFLALFLLHPRRASLSFSFLSLSCLPLFFVFIPSFFRLYSSFLPLSLSLDLSCPLKARTQNSLFSGHFLDIRPFVFCAIVHAGARPCACVHECVCLCACVLVCACVRVHVRACACVCEFPVRYPPSPPLPTHFPILSCEQLRTPLSVPPCYFRCRIRSCSPSCAASCCQCSRSRGVATTYRGVWVGRACVRVCVRAYGFTHASVLKSLISLPPSLFRVHA